MAGLWEFWKPRDQKVAPEVESVESCTILTTDSNPLTRHLHDRMPVILDDNDWDLWLDTEMQEPDVLQQMLNPYPDDLLTVDRVNPHVNNARHEGPECIEVQRELF